MSWSLLCYVYFSPGTEVSSLNYHSQVTLGSRKITIKLPEEGVGGVDLLKDMQEGTQKNLAEERQK